MDRNSKVLVVSTISMFSLFLFIAFGTDICRYYTNSSAANEPNLPLGSRVVVSIFLKPKRLDFVSYRDSDSIWANNKRIHRLVGLPKDTLEIKNGILFINHKNIDSTINLAYSYKIQKDIAHKLAQNNQLITLYNGRPYYNTQTDTVLVYTSKLIAKNNNLEKYRVISSKNKIDPFIKDQFGMNWNTDNFGPLILKEKEYFVIGDNRHNSEDSRMIGTINESRIIGRAIRF